MQAVCMEIHETGFPFRLLNLKLQAVCRELQGHPEY